MTRGKRRSGLANKSGGGTCLSGVRERVLDRRRYLSRDERLLRGDRSLDLRPRGDGERVRPLSPMVYVKGASDDECIRCLAPSI